MRRPQKYRVGATDAILFQQLVFGRQKEMPGVLNYDLLAVRWEKIKLLVDSECDY